MEKFTIKGKLLLIGVQEDEGKATLFDCVECTETGYILIDVVEGRIKFNYLPTEKMK